MFCPYCGSAVAFEHASFCPNCGHILDVNLASAGERRRTADERYVSGQPGAKGKMCATFIVCFLVCVAFCTSIAVIDGGHNGHPHEKIEIETITNGEYFELSGDFLHHGGALTVSLTDDGNIAFALDGSVSSQYDYYSWWFFDYDHVSSTNTLTYSEYTGERLDKAEPVLYYLSQKPGEYSVSVDCYVDTDGERIYKKTYSGTVTHVGNITKDYTWRYNGTEYRAELTFGYDKYRIYRDKNPDGRAVTQYSNVTSFITYRCQTINALAESLLKAYGQGPDVRDQDFASFVLSFVQICFDYPPYSSFMEADKYMYGQDEYFAYPLETIFYGMGDCEDTAILCASLFKALGYGAGVLIVPGHAVAAVALDEFAPSPYSHSNFEIISQNIKGSTYYACETAVDTYLGVGLIGSSGHNGHPYSWYVGKDGYGFYLV